MNIKHLQKEFGSVRRITCLTPDTYLRKMIAVSTTMNSNEKTAQTAWCFFDGLNYFDFERKDHKWIMLKEHTSWKEALKFHDEYVNSKGFSDCEEIRIDGNNRQ